MSYLLGIDLGTTFTAAAVCRREAGGWGPAELVALGNRGAAVGSVVYADPSGELLFGEPAERRVVTDPTRVAREFKRRIGDDTPMLLGGRPVPAPELAARFARWVTDTVTAREGGPPEAVAVTHPAGWGGHRTGLLAEALRAAGLGGVTLLSEPHAAAVCYAGTGRLPLGSTIAVYDLGGGTFDATVLRMAGPGEFELLGTPVGHDRLGGLDFDELIFDNLVEHHPEAFADVDPADPAQLGALALLRRECTEAKETLSADTETVIPIAVSGRPVRARLVRADFETMIRPAVEETVSLLAEAVLSASATTAELAAIVLVGGSARIPLVTEVLSAELNRPIAVDVDPKGAVALGAVLHLRTAAAPAVITGKATGTAVDLAPVREPAPVRAARVRPAPEPGRFVGGRRLLVVGGLTAAALVVGTIAAVPGHLAGVLSPAHADTSTVTTSPGHPGGPGKPTHRGTADPAHPGSTSGSPTSGNAGNGGNGTAAGGQPAGGTPDAQSGGPAGGSGPTGDPAGTGGPSTSGDTGGSTGSTGGDPGSGPSQPSDPGTGGGGTTPDPGSGDPTADPGQPDPGTGGTDTAPSSDPVSQPDPGTEPPASS